MPRIHTHLNLALRLLKRIEITNSIPFLLGNAYPDCFEEDGDKAMRLHYKECREDECHLDVFLENEEKNDFNFGYYFHLWVDNYMKEVDCLDISSSDCLICDMEEIRETILNLYRETYEGKELEAFHHIRRLESTPMPLYMVFEEKKDVYSHILDTIVDAFMEDNKYEEV